MKFGRRRSPRIVESALLSRDPLEREVKATHVRMFEEAGFKVCDLSQPRAVYGGLIDFPDVIAFYNDVTVLVEEKKNRGKVRPGQAAFRQSLLQHTGPHLYHLIAPTDDQVWNVINTIRGLPWRNRDKSVIHVVTGVAKQGDGLMTWPVKAYRALPDANAHATKANAVQLSVAERRKAIELDFSISQTERQKAILQLYNQYDKVNNGFNGHPDCGLYRVTSLDFEG